ncbi:hypothetical protein A4X09_0g3986 [Tilletia walkeri]|uniref:Nucleolar 27S pre-rRNA processing Urb2/Npa2 C-terminal domain-containing protein n=1 Tax=Tilletia walkeri TaxID=117179 RepID=A0A8X7T4B1_9BASI|nr:hypothetical protein A4X09_0g3986 [Tilletia walkeri]
MPSAVERKLATLEAVGIHTSEQLIKALKAPSDPPAGHKLSKVEIATLAAQANDALSIPDRQMLLANWVLELLSQSAKGKASSRVEYDRLWVLLDFLLSTESRNPLDPDAVKKLASQHPIVAILTAFAKLDAISGRELRSCSVVMNRLFLISAMKSVSNNFDQINKCLEACLTAISQWITLDEPSAYSILSDVFSCWSLACVHSSNLRKASKFFLGDMYSTWIIAFQKAVASEKSKSLATLIIEFGVIALLTDDTLRPYCITAADILEGSEPKGQELNSDELISTVIKSLQHTDQKVRQASLQMLPLLLAQMVDRLITAWPTLAPDSTISTVSGPLQQQLYVACLYSAVRRKLLDPIMEHIRKSPQATSSQAEARRKLLQQVHDLGMFSTASTDEEAWRSTFALLLDDIVNDVRLAPAEGFASLDLLWQLDSAGLEKDSVRLLTLVAQHNITEETPSTGFQAARKLVQHIVEHFSRTREIPRFCTLLCDAAEAASEPFSAPRSLLTPTSALISEGCVGAWGDKLRGFLVPNQVAAIVENFVVKSRGHCESAKQSSTEEDEADIDRSSTKRRRVQSKGGRTPRSSIDSGGIKGPSPAQKASAFFAMSSIIFRYLPAQESSATDMAQSLVRSVSEDLHPTTLTLLEQVVTSGGAIPAAASLAATLIQCLSSITSFYEEMGTLDISTLPILPRFTVPAHIGTATKKLPGDLRLSLLEAELIDSEQITRDPSTASSPADQSRSNLKAIVLQCLSDGPRHGQSDTGELSLATCQMLFSRWIPLLQGLFDFQGLVDLADRAIAVVATNEFLMTRFISDARSVECTTFLAAMCSAILQRLENLGSASDSNRVATVVTLETLDVIALPPAVRSILFRAVVKADLRSATGKEPAQRRATTALRKFIAEVLINDAPTDLQSASVEWLNNVPVDNDKVSSGPVQAATIHAAVAITHHLGSSSARAQGSADVLRAFISRTQEVDGVFGKRLSRNIAAILASSGKASGIPVSDSLSGHLNVSDTAVLEMTERLSDAPHDEKTLLDILDTLQSLQPLRRAGKAGTAIDTASLSYAEAVIRFLSGSDQQLGSSDIIAAVAFELLRLGWSISTDSQAGDNFTRQARWVASLLASPKLDKWTSALRSEVAVLVRESLAVSEYETSLQALEDSLDNLLFAPGSPGKEASAVLFTLTLFLCNGPEATGKTARAAFDRIISGLLALPIRTLQDLDPSLLVAIIDMLESVCQQKAVLLRVSETMAVIDLCTRLVSPSPQDFRSTEDVSATIFSGVVATLTAMVRQRQDILAGMMPSLTAALCQLITLLRSVSSDFGAKLVSAGHAGSAPAWLDLSKGSLGATEADLLSRLFLSITTKTAALPVIARQKKRGADGDPSGSLTTTTSLARPFAKHAIHVLVAYCRMLNAPLSTTDPNVRKALRPGLFALCDIIKNHERDAAMTSSLGPAEQVVFKDLWSRWEKQRYRGE